MSRTVSLQPRLGDVPARRLHPGVLGLAALAVSGAIAHRLAWDGVTAIAALLAATASTMWMAERHRPAPAGWWESLADPAHHDKGGLRAAALTVCLPYCLALALFVFFWPRADLLPWLAVLSIGGLAGIVAMLRGHPTIGLTALAAWHRQPRSRPFPWAVLRDHAVKAFFLPLMLTFLGGLWGSRPSIDLDRWFTVYAFLVWLLYLVDVALGTVGYLPAPRSARTGILSSNPYWDGWAAALICYPPFWLWFSGVFRYDADGLQWHGWLPQDSALWLLWGALIVGLLTVYGAATVAFGARFSNLTWRGLVDGGPYRWLRHPAYVSKNLVWWLTAVPFVSAQGWRHALHACLVLLGVNAIYMARALTEERHLLRYHAYRAYWRRMRTNGLQRWWPMERLRHGRLDRWGRRYPLAWPISILLLAWITSP